ncbi:hypothetical protein [Halomonas shantousis]
MNRLLGAFVASLALAGCNSGNFRDATAESNAPACRSAPDDLGILGSAAGHHAAQQAALAASADLGMHEAMDAEANLQELRDTMGRPDCSDQH